MFETPRLGKFSKCGATVVWAIVADHLLRDAKLCENLFEGGDHNTAWCRIWQSFDDGVLAVVVCNNQPLVPLKLKKISAYVAPGFWGHFMLQQWFSSLGRLVLLTNSTSFHVTADVVVYANPVHGISCQEFGLLTTKMGLVQLMQHLSLHVFGYDDAVSLDDHAVSG